MPRSNRTRWMFSMVGRSTVEGSEAAMAEVMTLEPTETGNVSAGASRGGHGCGARGWRRIGCGEGMDEVVGDSEERLI